MSELIKESVAILISYKNKIYLLLNMMNLSSVFVTFFIVCTVALDRRILHGSFFQPALSVTWGKAGFEAEFKYMAKLQMDHVIWQWTVDSKNKVAWYPTSLKGYKQVTNYDAVEASLIEAARNNMTVWIGLNDNSDWWKYYARDENWLKGEFAIGKSIVKDMWEKYGKKYAIAIAGFYVVFEMDNVNFFPEVEQKRMAAVYKDIADYTHSLTMRPIMIAPFFNANYVGRKMDAKEYAKLWHDVLLVANIDIIAMQDGVGVEHCKLVEVTNWFYQMRLAMASARPGSQLWSDLETFEMENATKLRPAPISRVLQQIQLEYPYVSRITSFSFNHYDSPQQGFTKQYEEYLKYVQDH